MPGVELYKDTGAVAVQVALAGEPQVTAVPPVGEGDPQGVRTLGHEIGHVIGLVTQPVAVAGPPGGQKLVADTGAVYLGLVDPVGGGVQPGAGHRPVDDELPAEERDGLAVPAGFREQAADA